jgi:hypothetical protein
MATTRRAAFQNHLQPPSGTVLHWQPGKPLHLEVGTWSYSQALAPISRNMSVLSKTRRQHKKGF